MRLTTIEQQAIHDAALRHFGVRPRLFGSRVDDSKRGGDIDLYIEAAVPPEVGAMARIRMVADIWGQIGERKIDVVVNSGGPNLPIYDVAKRDGVWL